MSLVLKICGNEWKSENRDKRELSVYKDLGYDVVVMAKGNCNDYGRIDSVDGYKVLRYSTRPLGCKFPKIINKIVSLFIWSYYAKQLDPDIISGHDLLPGFIISWLSTIFSTKQKILIYDAHELEMGRNSNRSKLKICIIKYLEKIMIKKCTFMMVVNDSIADEIYLRYRLKNRPVVVRNTPEKWIIDEEVCLETRKTIMGLFQKRIGE